MQDQSTGVKYVEVLLTPSEISFIADGLRLIADAQPEDTYEVDFLRMVANRVEAALSVVEGER